MDLWIIKYGALCSKSCTEQRFVTSDLQKRLMQTWFDFEKHVIQAAIDQWRDRLRSCVRAEG